MQTEQLILVDTFCVWHNVAVPFVNTLHELGLIDITIKDEKAFISENNLKQVEQLIRLHNELEINLEGVEVITYLLERIKHQHEEITAMQNRLSFYEV